LTPIGARIGAENQQLQRAGCYDHHWVVNGEPGPGYARILNGVPPLFSPNGEHFAYVAGDGSDWFVVVDHEAGPAHPDVLQRKPVFGPDGQRIAYIVKEDGLFHVALDGELGPPCETLGAASLVFSADGAHFAYAAKRDGEWAISLDGESTDEYDGILGTGPVFDADGALRCIAHRGGTVYRLRIGPAKP
jgi:hypothetical protein